DKLRVLTTNTSTNLIFGVQPVHGQNSTDFFNSLYSQPKSEHRTPLHKSMDRIGKYFKSDAPWYNTIGDPDSGKLACRQNYNVFMTDGYWNGSAPGGISDADGTNGPTITGPNGQSYTYSAQPPYKGTEWYSPTLADVAMHYWKHDLRPDDDMPNIVPTSNADPAFWQHMVNFTVGLGVFGNITPTADGRLSA